MTSQGEVGASVAAWQRLLDMKRIGGFQENEVSSLREVLSGADSSRLEIKGVERTWKKVLSLPPRQAEAQQLDID